MQKAKLASQHQHGRPAIEGMDSSQCCICSKDDTDSKLHAAGMLHTKKPQPNSEHIRNFTDGYVIWFTS